MVRNSTIVTLEEIFPGESYKDYISKLSDVPKQFLLDISSHFLRYDIYDDDIQSHKDLISNWFNENNSQFAIDVLDRIHAIAAKSPTNICIINPRSSLELMERALSIELNDKSLDKDQLEILLFKIYLSVNSYCVLKEDNIRRSVAACSKSLKPTALALTFSVPTFDITNFNPNTIFLCQIIKASIFFKMLSNKQDSENLLTAFYKKFNASDYKDYLKRIIPLSEIVLRANKEGKIDIILNSENSLRDAEFLDNFMIQISDYDLEEKQDHLILRNSPLIKMDDKYRIIYPLFVFEKIYNGLYFQLKEINDSLQKQEKVKDLRGMFTYHFSEKEMLYTVLQRSFNNNLVHFSGEESQKNKIDGALDYYLRNDDKVLLFESKDILLNSDIKSSYDFSIYYAEIKKKLYFDDTKPEKIKPTAVKQITNFIKLYYKGQFNLDTVENPNNLQIYPVIILHNRQLEVLGLNKLINIWFNDELELLKNEGYKIDNIKNITVINIDTLILYADQFQDGKLSLYQLIDEYLYFISDENLYCTRFKNQQEQTEFAKSQFVSFSTWVNIKYKWELPKMFSEEGYSLFDTM